MAEGEFALVRQYLETVLVKSASPVGAPTGDHDLYVMLADAAAPQRDEVALRKYAPRAEETAARISHTLYTAIAHRAWGVAHCLAGDYAEAEARLDQALKIFQKLDTRWQLGRTWFEFGELSRAQNKTEQARDYFSLALTAFEEMRAVLDAARTRAALESLG